MGCLCLVRGQQTPSVEHLLSLLLRHDKASFLYQILTCDQKCIIYDNRKRNIIGKLLVRSHWPLNGHLLKGSSVVLLVDQTSIFHCEHLESGKPQQRRSTRQNCRVSAASRKKQAALVNRRVRLHDNARPHIAKATKEVIKALGWEALSQPPYSMDIALLDC
ncbi:histone-lysine N-methyltransferase SETMAR-like [Stegodyphus dumicola]|uniref:histone-lysine N-methyltransferase SETMAR-like n=1 Tax=Stegodyphus dumicola TaxID=202533 RepID=UPI0015B02EEE|nr:histone-lysine N-methyltransferase SETMAR-like [Stegodyphus dumicola]